MRNKLRKAGQYTAHMTAGPLDVLQHLSGNLRAARAARGLSQQALAEASGVSRRMLVSLEAGDTNVSFATLDRIARVLGLTFAEMIRPLAGGEAPVLAWRGEQEGSHATLLQSHRLGGGAFELWEWRLAAGERYQAETDPAGFHEMLYVVDGTLTLKLGRRRILLTAGRSHLFATHTPYGYANEDDVPCVFLKNVIAFEG
jgi:transcriptional regulator with XRE-family HTH domain